MTPVRTKAGINKTDAGSVAHGQIGFVDALQWVFPTTVASYLTFHGSVRQEATGNWQD